MRIFALTAVFLLSGFTAAQAGPYLCYKAIKKFAKDVKAVKGEIDTFKSDDKGCGQKLACSGACRQSRRSFKKELKASTKACKNVCKSEFGKDKRQRRPVISFAKRQTSSQKRTGRLPRKVDARKTASTRLPLNAEMPRRRWQRHSSTPVRMRLKSLPLATFKQFAIERVSSQRLGPHNVRC